MRAWMVVILAVCYALALCYGLAGCHGEPEPATEVYPIDQWQPDTLRPDSIYISLTMADSFGCPGWPMLIYFRADSIACPLVLTNADTYDVFFLEPETELRVFESVEAYERWAKEVRP